MKVRWGVHSWCDVELVLRPGVAKYISFCVNFVPIGLWWAILGNRANHFLSLSHSAQAIQTLKQECVRQTKPFSFFVAKTNHDGVFFSSLCHDCCSNKQPKLCFSAGFQFYLNTVQFYHSGWRPFIATTPTSQIYVTRFVTIWWRSSTVGNRTHFSDDSCFVPCFKHRGHSVNLAETHPSTLFCWSSQLLWWELGFALRLLARATPQKQVSGSVLNALRTWNTADFWREREEGKEGRCGSSWANCFGSFSFFNKRLNQETKVWFSPCFACPIFLNKVCDIDLVSCWLLVLFSCFLVLGTKHAFYTTDPLKFVTNTEIFHHQIPLHSQCTIYDPQKYINKYSKLQREVTKWKLQSLPSSMV